MKILIIEDDIKLSRLMAEYLSENGFSVEQEQRGDKAIYRILHERYDLIILDINLPKINGLQICKMVRYDYPGHILILTASGKDQDHIIGLNYGADDYVSKPINPPVLLARIQATLKRSKPRPHQFAMKEIAFGKLHIDLEKRLVTLNNSPVDLKPTEFDLLALLAINAGTNLSRDNIMHALRGIDYDGIDRSIDLRISYLRKKLDDDLEHPYRIITARGKGYVFQPDAWE